MSDIARNLARIRASIARACSRAGRSPDTVRLVGVTKTVDVGRVREGVSAGIAVLGENYVQEARQKREALSDVQVEWHFIGHLQSNKAKVAVECFDWIHTVDREKLARELDRQALKKGRRIPVLIQVNTGDEASKSGVPPQKALELFRAVTPLEGLSLRGLMTLPPYLEDLEAVRPHFRLLREILDRMRQEASEPEALAELSMGMSHDFETAIEEGATMIRVGTALFGKRD